MDTKVKILVVDDRQENLLSMKAVLDSSMYYLVTASSGEEALKCILQEEFAVILLDVQMPGIDGFETARIIRSRERTKYTPIIFITAIQQESEQVQRGYALGAIDYIFKPIDPENLKSKIAGFVHIYQHREQLEQIVQQRTHELMLANEKLRCEIEERRQLASIVENSDDAIIGKNLNGNIISWNGGAERMYGYTTKEIIGYHISTIVPDDCKGETKGVFLDINNGMPNKNYETLGQKKNGEQIHVSITASPIKSTDGTITGLSSIHRDISDKKQFENQMARLDRLNIVGEMAAGISHEVRNPITTVRGFLQMMGGKKEYQKDKNYFNLMIEELDRANSIITEFLSIGKNNPTEMKVQNLNEIVKTLSPLLQADAFEQNNYLELILNDIPDLPLNSKEIRQVILNLVRNGLEAMPRSGGKLTISTYLEKGNVVLMIEDEGNGMKPEVLENLGTPFYTTKDNGTGLGLATCFGICSRHNAKVDIKTGSEGTKFKITFNTISI
ncbi:MAG: response regulator [Firmicutes bacterium]|nr:response regulator [Bacillota bacterium]